MCRKLLPVQLGNIRLCNSHLRDTVDNSLKSVELCGKYGKQTDIPSFVNTAKRFSSLEEISVYGKNECIGHLAKYANAELATDAIFAHYENFPNLKILSVFDMATDHGFPALSQLASSGCGAFKQLTHFSLGDINSPAGTNIVDGIVNHLAHACFAKQLTNIRLERVKLTTKSLAELVKHCKALIDLEIHGAEGAFSDDVLGIAFAQEACLTKLHCLRLTDCLKSAASLASLATAQLPALKEFTIEGGVFDSEGFRAWKGASWTKQLTCLELMSAEIRDEGLKHIVKCDLSKLEVFDNSEACVSEAGMEAFIEAATKRFTNIKELRLGDWKCSSQALGMLHKLPKLQSLIIDGDISNESLPALRGPFPCLGYLNIACRDATQENLGSSSITLSGLLRWALLAAGEFPHLKCFELDGPDGYDLSADIDGPVASTVALPWLTGAVQDHGF